MNKGLNKDKCAWAGSTLDYMSPARGDQDLRDTYSHHSCFRLEDEE